MHIIMTSNRPSPYTHIKEKIDKEYEAYIHKEKLKSSDNPFKLINEISIKTKIKDYFANPTLYESEISLLLEQDNIIEKTYQNYIKTAPKLFNNYPYPDDYYIVLAVKDIINEYILSENNQ